MTRPMRVAVVQPYRAARWWVNRIVVGVALALLNGLIVMLILGAVSPWHLGYWQTVLALIALRIAQVGSGWSTWTWPGKKGDLP